MKKIILSLSVLAVTGCATHKPYAVEVSSEDQKIAYSVGYQTAQVMKAPIVQQGLENNLDQLFSGIRDGIEKSDDDLMISMQDIAKYIEIQKGRLTVKAEREKEEIMSRNISQSKNFMEVNAERKEVIVLESGVQYEVLASSDHGRSPSPDGRVVVNYEGRLIDGTVFDTSASFDAPAQITLSRAIVGWQQVLPMMKEGDKWRVAIPYHLAYGEEGSGNRIPPYSTLIFDIELLEVI